MCDKFLKPPDAVLRGRQGYSDFSGGGKEAITGMGKMSLPGTEVRGLKPDFRMNYPALKAKLDPRILLRTGGFMTVAGQV